MIRRPPRSTLSSSSAASDVYKRQAFGSKHRKLKEKFSTKRAGVHGGRAAPPKSLDFFNANSGPEEPEEPVISEPEEGSEEEDGPGLLPDAIEDIDAEPGAMSREQVSLLRKRMKISVEGSDCPDPLRAFDELEPIYGLPKFLADSVRGMKYKKPSKIQMQAIPAMVHGREMLCCAPTGSGKTAAFLIPLLARLKFPGKTLGAPRGLVVLPTAELAMQTKREAVKLLGEVSTRWKVIALTKATKATVKERRVDLLLSTPGAMLSLLPDLDLSRVEVLVFDEADKLFEMGFVEQVDQVLTACTHKKIQRALFSATLGQGVENLARSVLKDPIRITIGRRGGAAEQVKQSLLYIGQEEGKMLAVRQMVKRGIKTPAILFVQSKERAQQLFHEMIYDGMNVDLIHSDRTKAQREAVVDKFRSGKVWFLICTDLLARGMDFKGVKLVINFDFPQSVSSYVHRIGRTGRGGKPGEAVTFFGDDDVELLRSIAQTIKDSGLSLIHISEPTRLLSISYAVFCLKKKNKTK
eukprot:TRINITY_DN49152_c0_g1_i1.p1 TRINITY_DN49152_c0_g1~~TRINITY_DN49152_c0_g1_i1.p1  ORF type:complete len:523 (+),score=147.19 TRINITY_DN49152_c0_g1_i1:72-1640(+)